MLAAPVDWNPMSRSPWWLVAGVFVALAMSSGFGFYNLSVYMNALADERGFVVAEISSAIGLLFIVSGIAGIGVARLIERIDVRWVMLAGAAIASTALSLVAAATEIWHVWLLFALFGFGNAGVSLIPGTTLVTRWFPGANRSIALSVASTGLSTGGILLTPVSAALIHDWGISAAMPWFGVVFFAVVAPIALVLIRSWPDGAAGSDPRRPAADAGDAFRSRFFIGSTVAYVMVMGAQVGGIAHLFNHVEAFTDHVVASTAVSLVAGTSIVGRLAGGVVVTRVPIRWFTLANIVGQSIGMVLLARADATGWALFGAVVFGLTVGNLLMLQPLLIAEAFGVARYPKIFSYANAASTLGVAGGPVLMGFVHDAASYVVSFYVAAAISVVSFCVFFLAGSLPDAETEPPPSDAVE